MTKNHEISVHSLTNAILAYVKHRNTVTRKFKMYWFPNEGRYLVGSCITTSQLNIVSKQIQI